LHMVFSAYAKQVIHEELGELQIPSGTVEHSDKSMNAPLPAAAQSLCHDCGAVFHGHAGPDRPRRQ
jgi:hypothetical protein